MRYRQIQIDGKWELVEITKLQEEDQDSHYIMGDLPDYTSPIDGRVISGRKQRREDLKRNNCVEYDPGIKDDAKRITRDRERQADLRIGEALVRTAYQLRDGMTKRETNINPAHLFKK